MVYKVYVLSTAKKDLDSFVSYLLFECNSKKAALGLLTDFNQSMCVLSYAAESFPFCQDIELKEKGFRRLCLAHHKYYVIYHVNENNVYVAAVLHRLQDLGNKVL